MGDNKNLLEIFESDEFAFQFSDYNAMCNKAKSFVFSYLLSQKENERYAAMLNCYDCFDSKLTPIEQIFYVAFRLYTSDFNVETECDTDIPFNAVLNEEITVQKEVDCNNKRYVIDFELNFSRKNLNGEYIYPNLKNLKYAIELDGYDYHSNKAQMTHDYERENDLKELGYSVIRFTGSQVYKKPLSCVDKLIKIIVSDINRGV